MGGLVVCQCECPSFLSKAPSKKKSIIKIYNQVFSQSSFRKTCIAIVQRYYDQSLNQIDQQVLKNSIFSTSHYEVNSLNHSSYDQKSDQSSDRLSQQTQNIRSQLPFSLSHMPDEQRSRYLCSLIKQSYLFVDLTDCIYQERTSGNYQRYIKHQLLKQDKELDRSFVHQQTFLANLQESLRDFDQKLISLLQHYVKFCRQMKHQFLAQNQRFLGRLSLNLQSQIIRRYVGQEFRRNNTQVSLMLEDVAGIIDILMVTVEHLYNFRASSNQNAYNFYNQMNLYSMVTSLLFQGERFVCFIIQKINQCFRHTFKQYSLQAQYTNQQFINDFIALNSTIKPQNQNQSRNSLASLLEVSQQKYKQINLFVRSGRMLEKILQKQIPLFKLRMVYELNKEMSRQLQELKDELSTRFNILFIRAFTRETQLLVIRWLLNTKKTNIGTICAHLMFTYKFIHYNYKIAHQGSCLTTFIQQIQRITQYTFQN